MSQWIHEKSISQFLSKRVMLMVLYLHITRPWPEPRLRMRKHHNRKKSSLYVADFRLLLNFSFVFRSMATQQSALLLRKQLHGEFNVENLVLFVQNSAETQLYLIFSSIHSCLNSAATQHVRVGVVVFI